MYFRLSLSELNVLQKKPDKVAEDGKRKVFGDKEIHFGKMSRIPMKPYI